MVNYNLLMSALWLSFIKKVKIMRYQVIIMTVKNLILTVIIVTQYVKFELFAIINDYICQCPLFMSWNQCCWVFECSRMGFHSFGLCWCTFTMHKKNLNRLLSCIVIERWLSKPAVVAKASRRHHKHEPVSLYSHWDHKGKSSRAYWSKRTRLTSSSPLSLSLTAGIYVNTTNILCRKTVVHNIYHCNICEI